MRDRTHAQTFADFTVTLAADAIRPHESRKNPFASSPSTRTTSSDVPPVLSSVGETSTFDCPSPRRMSSLVWRSLSARGALRRAAGSLAVACASRDRGECGPRISVVRWSHGSARSWGDRCSRVPARRIRPHTTVPPWSRLRPLANATHSPSLARAPTAIPEEPRGGPAGPGLKTRHARPHDVRPIKTTAARPAPAVQAPRRTRAARAVAIPP